MREYDKTTLKVAERVFEKGDEILEQRRKRAAVIRRRTYAVSGLCAAVIVCFGAWRFSSSVKAPYDSSEIIVSTETTSAVVSTTGNSTRVTTAENKSESIISASGSVTASTSIKNKAQTTTAAATASGAMHTTGTTASLTISRRTTALTSTTAAVTVYTKTTDVRETCSPIVTTTSSRIIEQGTSVTISSEESYNPVRTSAAVCTTSGPQDMGIPTTRSTTETIEETDYKELFRSNPSTVEVKTSKLNYYEKQNVLISPDRIDKRRIYVSDVRITRPNGLPMLIGMEVYDILDISREKAVAVKLRGTEEYYLFKNPDVKAEELYS